MTWQSPLFSDGDLVWVRLGSYGRAGRIKAHHWKSQAIGGYYVYEVGPLEVSGIESPGMTGVFNEGHLSEVDAITLLGAIARPIDSTALGSIFPGVRLASELRDG